MAGQEMNDLGMVVIVGVSIFIASLLSLNVLFMLYRKRVVNSLEDPTGKPLKFHSPDDEPRSFRQFGFARSLIGTWLLYSWVVFFAVGYFYMILFTWLSYAPQFFAPTFALEAFGGWNGLMAPWLVIFTAIHIVAMCLILMWDALRTRFMIPVDQMIDATHVMIEEDVPFQTDDNLLDPDIVGSSYSYSEVKQSMRKLKARYKRAVARTVLPIIHDEDGTSRIEYTCVRYVHSDEDDCFHPTGIVSYTAAQVHSAVAAGGLKAEEAEVSMATCGRNEINVYVPGIFESLLREFSDFTYVFNSIGTWSYIIFSTWNIGLFWLILTISSGTFRSLFIVRPNQKKIRDLAQLHTKCEVLRDGKWKRREASEIVLGDIIAVEGGSVKLPCDGIVVDGSLVCNESMLTGEPMPIQKMPVENSQKATITKKNVAYAGTECMQSAGPHDGKAIMIATAVGALTTRGQLVRMVLFPTSVRFKYNDQLPQVYGIICIYMVILMAIYVSPLMDLNSWIATYLMVLNTIAMCLSPMLPVSMVMGQTVTAQRLEKSHEIHCLQPGRIPIAGKISTMVFDKTGTITKDGMDFDAVVAVDGSQFGQEIRFNNEESSPSGENGKIIEQSVPRQLRHALASCHTVTTLKETGEFVGNQVEVSMVRTVGWKICDGGSAVESPTGSERLEVIKKLDFDHCRMTSGVVVRSKQTGETEVFIKGSYEKIQSISHSVPGDYVARTQKYAKEGYYVLGIASKSLPVGLTPQQVADLTRDSLESGLGICGLLLFRNEMKRDSKKAIKDLRKGAIRSVICTGDNALTGISIGRQCTIVDPAARVLLGDITPSGELEWKDPDSESPKNCDPVDPEYAHCDLAVTQGAWRRLHAKPIEMEEFWTRLVVFARMKPEDKINVVKYFQSRALVVGMCGDGGNDCGGLRAAHAGLALSDAEASMVSPFSTGRDGKSLLTVVDLVREGRACLSTNMATFQYFVAYGFILTTIRTILAVYATLSLGEYVWLSMDIGIGMVMVWTMTQSRPTHRLCHYRPTATLLGPRTISAIAVPYFGCVIALLVGQALLWRNDWYDKVNPIFDLHLLPSQWMLRGDNYDSAVGMLVLLLALVNTAYVNTYGGSFRRNILFNPGVNMVYAIFLFGIAWLLFSGATQFNCVYRVNCDTKESLASRDLTLLSMFSVGGVGGCFLGPQVEVWQDQMAKGGWGPDSWLPNNPQECLPPPGYDTAPLNSTLISQNGCVGPNNCFSKAFKWEMFCVLFALTLFQHLYTKVVLQGFVADRLRKRQAREDDRRYHGADSSDSEEETSGGEQTTEESENSEVELVSPQR